MHTSGVWPLAMLRRPRLTRGRADGITDPGADPLPPMRVADFRPVNIQENEKELAYWPSWAEFRRFLDVCGPVYPWHLPSAAPTRAVSQAATAPVSVRRTPLYSGRHFECSGELVVTFPAGQGPYDPIMGHSAEDRRRTLDVHGAIAEAYAKAAAEPEKVYRRRILTRTFDLWAQRFTDGQEARR